MIAKLLKQTKHLKNSAPLTASEFNDLEKFAVPQGSFAAPPEFQSKLVAYKTALPKVKKLFPGKKPQISFGPGSPKKQIDFVPLLPSQGLPNFSDYFSGQSPAPPKMWKFSKAKKGFHGKPVAKGYPYSKYLSKKALGPKPAQLLHLGPGQSGELGKAFHAKKFQLIQKELHSKMHSFKFQSNKKIFKTMESKIKKLMGGKKESLKSVKTVKKAPKKRPVVEKKQIFAGLPRQKRAQKLSELSEAVANLERTRYSDCAFGIKADVFATFVAGLAQFEDCEPGAELRQSFSRLERNFQALYDPSAERIDLGKCLGQA